MTPSALQTLVSLCALAAFVVFVVYAAYLFLFVLPRQSYQKRQARNVKRNQAEAELDAIIADFEKQGPSRNSDFSSSYEGWLNRVHYARCLIDLDRYPFAISRFPAELCYRQHFPQTGPGEPSFTFYDVTLAIRKKQGLPHQFSDFIQATDINLDAQSWDAESAFQATHKWLCQKVKHGDLGVGAAAILFWRKRTPQVLTAVDSAIPANELKNILLIHILRDLDLSACAAVALVVTDVDFHATNTNLFLHAESPGHPPQVAIVTFPFDADPILTHLNKPAVFFAPDKSDANSAVQDLLNLRYI